MDKSSTKRTSTPVLRHESAVRPGHGDVVVTAVPDGSFTLREVPGGPALSWASRASAVAMAQTFARAQGVGVWFDDGRAVVRIQLTPPRRWRTRAAALAGGLLEQR